MSRDLTPEELSEMSTRLEVKLEPGDVAPRYIPEVTKQLGIKAAVITEKGMVSGLPIVDLQMIDASGKMYFVSMSGRILLSLASVVRGVNLRNHGQQEP